jgi:hypothetical protein
MQTIIRLGLAAAAMASALVCSTACNAAPTVESRSVHEIANSPARFVPALTGALPRTLLYVSTLSWSTGTGSVFVYDAYGKNSQPIGSISISSGFPEGLWTDKQGDVYVAVVNSSSPPLGYVDVYTPDLQKVVRRYTQGISGPSGGAFDRSGNLYIANLCGRGAYSCAVIARTRHTMNSTSGYVGVYPPGSSTPSEYLQGPINIAVGVALDSTDNVFVVNNTGGAAWNVVEFPARSMEGFVVPFRGLPSQRWVGAVTFDPSDALVVSVNSAIDFFPKKRGRPAGSLTKGVLAADGLAYGADGTLFAGNFEFEQNEGNAIAFPPGSDAPNRSFAVPYNSGVTSIAIGPSSSLVH